MPNSPLTNTRIPDTTYVPDIADIVHKAIYDIEVNACPRFTGVAARDTAYSAWVAAGNTLNDGRSCWTDGTGFWDRVDGAWIKRNVPTTDYIAYSSGWGAYGSYFQPRVSLAADGQVMLRGTMLRTGANLTLPVAGTPITVGALPTFAIPTGSVSPPVVVGLGPGQDTYPARIYIAANSANVQIVGMSTGAGTFQTGIGFIDFNGAGWF